MTAVSLEDTVRTPWQTWPDNLLVGVTGLRAESVCSEKLLAKVNAKMHVPCFFVGVLEPKYTSETARTYLGTVPWYGTGSD